MDVDNVSVSFCFVLFFFFLNNFSVRTQNLNCISQAEVDSENFISRGYQDELFKVCIQRNTIIYLPTGAGKTFIAIMAMKHFAKDLKS